MSWPLKMIFAPGHLIAGKAHQRHEQGGLAGAVGAEQDKGFAASTFRSMPLSTGVPWTETCRSWISSIVSLNYAGSPILAGARQAF